MQIFSDVNMAMTTIKNHSKLFVMENWMKKQKGRCRGEEQRIYLNPGQQVVLQSAGFEGEGMPLKCKVGLFNLLV